MAEQTHGDTVGRDFTLNLIQGRPIKAADRCVRLLVAVTGASGMIYARMLLEAVAKDYDTVYLTSTEHSRVVMRNELDIDTVSGLLPEAVPVGEDLGVLPRFVVLDNSDLSAPPASGSHEYEGMVVIPCSMGTLGRIASGVSSNLIERAADVCLKERRKLVLVTRETPLNLIHLRNMTTLAEAGAVILPACPAFYNGPKSLEDAAEFVVDRVLRVLGSSRRLTADWGEERE